MVGFVEGQRVGTDEGILVGFLVVGMDVGCGVGENWQGVSVESDSNDVVVENPLILSCPLNIVVSVQYAVPDKHVLYMHTLVKPVGIRVLLHCCP